MPQGKHPQHEIKDSELLARYLDGDRKAFTALVRRYSDDLYNFLVRFIGDKALAEDVFQETFLQLHISAATFDLSKRLKPWLFTIAANKARDLIRSRSRRPAASLDVGIATTDGSDISYIDQLAADIPEVSENLMNTERRTAVLDTVRQLPEHLKTVLLLNYFEGMSYKDISESLSIPMGTVKSRLHGAVGEFARLWKEKSQRDDNEKQ